LIVGFTKYTAHARMTLKRDEHDERYRGLIDDDGQDVALSL
jgi:hypothetical protein